MNPLPQRKKTAEEIAKLREQMGFPAGPPASPVEPPPSPPPRQMAAPVLPAPSAASAPQEPRPHREPKQVRSLRKSEQVPVLRPVSTRPNADSIIPVQRHSDQQLNELRRADVLAAPQPGTYLMALNAHPALLALGYVPVIAAASMPFFDRLLFDVGYEIPAALCGIGLILAAFIFLKKKLSLHHAGFIVAIAALVIIFGSLYYFPHLRNAS